MKVPAYTIFPCKRGFCVMPASMPLLGDRELQDLRAFSTLKEATGALENMLAHDRANMPEGAPQPQTQKTAPSRR